MDRKYFNSYKDYLDFIKLSESVSDALNKKSYKDYITNDGKSIVFIYKYYNKEIMIYASTFKIDDDKKYRKSDFDIFLINSKYDIKENIWIPAKNVVYRIRLYNQPNMIYHNGLWLKDNDFETAGETILEYKLLTMKKSKRKYESDKLQYDNLKDLLMKRGKQYGF